MLLHPMNLDATTTTSTMATMTAAAMMMVQQQQEAALLAQQQQQQLEPSPLLAIETLGRLAEAVLKEEQQLRHLQFATLGFAPHQATPLPGQESSKPTKKSATTTTAASKKGTKRLDQLKKPCLKKKALRKNPELEWAQVKARMLSLEEIRKLKHFFTMKQKTVNKMSGMKMTDISSHYIFQHGSKHDHSNFAKWLKNNRGRNGRGGTNLLLLLIWFRLSHGEDYEKAFQNIENLSLDSADETTTITTPAAVGSPKEDAVVS